METLGQNTSSTVSGNVSYTHAHHTFTTFPDGYSRRNLVLGICGIAVNVITFPLVAVFSRLNLGIKILILNFILSDTIFMSSLIIYGAVKSSHRSDGEGCWEIIYLLLMAMVMSYLLTFQISLVNFLAIYKPFRFRSGFKTKSVIIAVICGWVYSIGLLVGCVGFDFPHGKACMPLATIPRSGVAGIAISTIVCFSGVLALNTASIVLAKRQQNLRKWVLSASQPVASFSQSKASKTPYSNASEGDSIIPTVSDHSRKFRNKVSPLSTNQIIEAPNTSNDNELTLPKSTNERRAYPSGSGFSSGQNETTPTEDEMSEIKNPPECPPGSRSSLLHKVEIVLLILTTWSSLLSLPFILYMIWLAAFAVEREAFASQDLGIVCSSLIIVNCLSNPFFYAMRFIEWNMIRQKIRDIARCF